jgi:hypothetical protein
MCQFFSFTTNGDGNYYYFNHQQRMELKKDNPNHYDRDSHASICEFFGINEDKCNKYEYKPKDGKFKIDQINSKDDSIRAENWVKKLNFDKVIDPKDITDSWDAYWYCRNVKDDSEVRKLITDSYDAYWYCMDVRDDPEIRKYITDSDDAYWYCRYIKDDPKVRKYITDSRYAYWYCVEVEDRPEIRKLIK